MRRPVVARITLRPPEHRHGLELDRQPVGVVFQIGVVESKDFAGWVFEAGPGGGGCLGAFGHHSSIRAVDENGGHGGIGLFQECCGLMALYCDHEETGGLERRAEPWLAGALKGLAGWRANRGRRQAVPAR